MTDQIPDRRHEDQVPRLVVGGIVLLLVFFLGILIFAVTVTP